MQQQHILVSAENAIATVTLNRPQKRNAITLAMWTQLAAIFSELSAADDVRVIILAGADGNFSAGADISEFSRLRGDIESGRRYEAKAEGANANCCIDRSASPMRSGYSIAAVRSPSKSAPACDWLT